MTKRNSYTREFKLEAVRLLETGDKKATDLARELGVPRNKLYQWREALKAKNKDSAFPGSGRRSGREAELAAVKRENARLKDENEILKKAARYFAKESS